MCAYFLASGKPQNIYSILLRYYNFIQCGTVTFVANIIFSNIVSYIHSACTFSKISSALTGALIDLQNVQLHVIVSRFDLNKHFCEDC